MILSLMTLAVIAALASGGNLVTLLISALLIAYASALSAVLWHEHNAGHVDADWRMHPR